MRLAEHIIKLVYPICAWFSPAKCRMLPCDIISAVVGEALTVLLQADAPGMIGRIGATELVELLSVWDVRSPLPEETPPSAGEVEGVCYW